MDRVSSLPDELLCHILSFLTTKEAALTSVLSKRWRNLLAFVPNLDIDDSVFLHPEEGKWKRHEIKQSFMDFVDRILALQGNSPIKKFSIKCLTEVDSDHVNRWICNVLQRGVSCLQLLNHPENNYWQSSEVFRSKTLVELKLGNVTDLSLQAGDCFLPLLKTLVLESVFFHSDLLQMLLPGCPALEKLDMAELTWIDDAVSNMTVSSASLKTLVFHPNCWVDNLSFQIPSLVYLEYSDSVVVDYSLVNLENLVEAQIKLILTDDQIERARARNYEDDVFIRLGNVVKLLVGICNVHKLCLSADTCEVISLCCKSIPAFNNLKWLCIESVYDRGWKAMPFILTASPHLETLVLEGLLHRVTDKCGDACPCVSGEYKGRSLASSPVKKIQIKGFQGANPELNMIEHFLEYFPYLKKMEIYAGENDPRALRFGGNFNTVVKMFELYNKIHTCDVEFLVRGTLDKKWTTAQCRRVKSASKKT